MAPRRTSRPIARPPRILLCVEPVGGFGHLNIASELARTLKTQGADVLVACSPLWHAEGIFDFGGCPISTLPEVHRPERPQAAAECCREFNPDVIVWEMFPFMQYRSGRRPEECEAIHNLYADSPRKPAFVSLARDIISPATDISRVLELLEAHFDHVLVCSDGKFFTLADCHPKWKEIPVPVSYIGNIVSPLPPDDLAEVTYKPVVVFSSGDLLVDDPLFFSAVVKARRHSKHFGAQPWEIYFSPDYNRDNLAELRDLAAAEGGGMISVTRALPRDLFLKRLAICSAAIVRGGYNTTFALAAARKPFVVAPLRELEQTMRANRLSDRRWAKHLFHNRQSDPQATAAALDETRALTPPSELNTNGAARAAETLIELAEEHRKNSVQARAHGERSKRMR